MKLFKRRYLLFALIVGWAGVSNAEESVDYAKMASDFIISEYYPWNEERIQIFEDGLRYQFSDNFKALEQATRSILSHYGTSLVRCADPSLELNYLTVQALSGGNADEIIESFTFLKNLEGVFSAEQKAAVAQSAIPGIAEQGFFIFTINGYFEDQQWNYRFLFLDGENAENYNRERLASILFSALADRNVGMGPSVLNVGEAKSELDQWSIFECETVLLVAAICGGYVDLIDDSQTLIDQPRGQCAAPELRSKVEQQFLKIADFLESLYN